MRDLILEICHDKCVYYRPEGLVYCTVVIGTNGNWN